MSAHTPGPWEYHAAGNYHGYSIAPVGTLPTLAAVERPVGGTTINVTAFNFPGETEPNARLIAAAPELLEALRLMVDWHGKRESASLVGTPADALLPIEEQEGEVQQAMRAIAKATQP